MSKSSDPGHFFQTEAALANATRRAAKASNTAGIPIKVTSKILSTIPDPLCPFRVYISEAGGLVRRVDLETQSIDHTYRGHKVPTTCLAVSPNGKKVYGGSWDKTIIGWDAETRERVVTFEGHTDFVKSLLLVPCGKGTGYPEGLLLSGGSDKAIIIWDAATGKELKQLKGHTRAVGTLALDPVESTPEVFIIYSGGSSRDLRKWRVPVGDVTSAQEIGEPIVEHDTNVHRIRFLGDDGDCWTASADFTARRLDVRDGKKKDGQRSDTVFRHADYVNDVLMDPTGRFAITACRDEDVKLWDIGTGSLYHTFVGHAEEVSGLALVGHAGETLVSVSIDATVRKWSLKPADLETARKEAAAGAKKEEEQKPKESMLTEEEERELAELMEDSD